MFTIQLLQYITCYNHTFCRTFERFFNLHVPIVQLLSNNLCRTRNNHHGTQHDNNKLEYNIIYVSFILGRF